MTSRRLVASVSLAAILAAALAPHRHAGLEEEPVGEAGSLRVLTTHNPRSSAAHWHAIIRFVEESPCLACHGQRHAGIPSLAALFLPILRGRALTALPPRSAISVARFTHLSRGPPCLL